MSLNVPMLRRKARRLLSRGARDIRSLASKEWTLCPAESVNVAPALFLDGALDKITGLSPWRDRQVDFDLVNGCVVNHAASTAHVVQNVELVSPCIYAGPARAQPGFGRERVWRSNSDTVVRLESANLVANWTGSCFFGNHLLDDFPLALIAEGDPTNITLPTKPYTHSEGYRKLVGLLPCPLIDRAQIGELTIYTDFAQNAFKVRRHRELRARMQRSCGAERSSPGVFIRRGDDGERRKLTNEPEVIATLQSAGFSVVDPAGSTAEQVARGSINARIVVAVEGSHLSHAIFTAADEAVFLVLQPPDRFAMAYKEFTDCMDMRFAFLVGDKTADGFSIDVDDIRRMLDRLM